MNPTIEMLLNMGIVIAALGLATFACIFGAAAYIIVSVVKEL